MITDGVPAPAQHGAAGTSTSGDLLGLLRRHTGAAHAHVDARLQSGGPPMSETTFRAFLRATSAVVLPLELPLALLLGSCFVKAAVGERHARLEHDLRKVGSDLAPACPGLPVIDGRAAAFGAGYVVLGSHLGGEVIVRQLFGRDPADDAPTSYLRLFHPGTGVMWKTFVEALTAFGRGADDTARAHTAAVALAVFTAFGLALDREGVAR